MMYKQKGTNTIAGEERGWPVSSATDQLQHDEKRIKWTSTAHALQLMHLADASVQVAQLQTEGQRLEEANRAAEGQMGQARAQSLGLANQVKDCRARIAQQDALLNTSR